MSKHIWSTLPSATCAELERLIVLLKPKKDKRYTNRSYHLISGYDAFKGQLLKLKLNITVDGAIAACLDRMSDLKKEKKRDGKKRKRGDNDSLLDLGDGSLKDLGGDDSLLDLSGDGSLKDLGGNDSLQDMSDGSLLGGDDSLQSDDVEGDIQAAPKNVVGDDIQVTPKNVVGDDIQAAPRKKLRFSNMGSPLTTIAPAPPAPPAPPTAAISVDELLVEVRDVDLNAAQHLLDDDITYTYLPYLREDQVQHIITKMESLVSYGKLCKIENILRTHVQKAARNLTYYN